MRRGILGKMGIKVCCELRTFPVCFYSTQGLIEHSLCSHLLLNFEPISFRDYTFEQKAILYLAERNEKCFNTVYKKEQ